MSISKNEVWKSTIATGMANYLDSGSIVAGSVGLALWTKAFGINNTTLGLLSAFSSNAISAGIGALVGGYICDKVGRKKIYSYDLLIYIVGVLIIMLVQNTSMLFVGYIITGLAVGADIPASWTLIAENSPAKERGKHSGIAQVFWSLGPICTLLLSLAVSSLGMLGVRIVFLHLAIVALAAWILRQTMGESQEWENEKKKINQIKNSNAAADEKASLSVKSLFKGKSLASLVFLILMYGIWNLAAGTNGFYTPYIERTIGGATQQTSVIIQIIYFSATLASTMFLFMPLSDKVKHRALFAVGSLIQVVGMSLFFIFKLNFVVSILYELLFGIGCGIGQQQFFQLWSGELFPTRFRSTAQGVMFSIVRIGLGFWSFLVPTITSALGFRGLAVFLSAFLLISGIIGIVGAPNTRGKTLKQIEMEQNISL